MWNVFYFLIIFVSFGYCFPAEFQTKRFVVGIEYEHSLPMSGASNRFRHRNNYDPFFVTATASARKGYVLDYLVVTATTDAGGEVDFRMVQGQAGTSKMVFQLVSNHSDFLAYSYMAYGIKKKDYRKMANHITIPMASKSLTINSNHYFFVLFIALIKYSLYYF